MKRKSNPPDFTLPLFLLDKLERVYIPASVVYIEEDMFNMYPKSLVILAPSGSYAEAFARKAGIPFVADNGE